MFKASKTVVCLCLVSLLFFGIGPWALGDEKKTVEPFAPPSQAKEQSIQYKINSYTSPEQKTAAEVAAKPIPPGYERKAESARLALYAFKDIESILIQNKRSGYVWSTSPEEKTLEKDQLNTDWGSALRSPFLVEFFDESAMLRRGSYKSLGGKTEEIKQIPGGIAVTYVLETIGVTFTMEVKIEEDSLVVRFPDASIVEKGAGKLASIQPFPFLGAVRKNEVPGYIFIPDGTGALIRFQNMHSQYDQAFDGRVYGMDEAVESPEDSFTREEERISVPVFGMVHRVKQHGFLGIVEDGKYNARITAYPSGLNTEYYWASPKFIVRNAYFQPTSKSMGGFNTFQKDRNKEDRQVRYVFLNAQDADYVGMAKTYRNYLEGRGVLSKKTEGQENIPLRVEILGADKEPGLLGTDLVKMTSFKEAEGIIDTLLKEGIPNITTVFRGWGSGGVNGNNPDKFPVPSLLGGAKGLKELQKNLKDKGVSLYLYSDYVNAHGSNDNFSSKSDGIRTISNQVLQNYYRVWFDTESSGDMDVYFMNPKVAAGIAQDDAERFEEMGIDAVAVDKAGWLLLSDWRPKNKISRGQSADQYEKLSQTLKSKVAKVGFFQPFDYLWKYSDQMFDLPVYSSQYMFSTDTVPFLQIVLHGYRDYFAPHFNYNASPQEYLLRMVEYGAYPSYYVTHEPSWKLKNTLSSHLFTSYFPDWRSDIKATYDKMNAALKQIQNATIEQRNVIDWGVVETVYSNGVTIIVNYRAKDMQHEGRTVPQMDFAVIGGE